MSSWPQLPWLDRIQILFSVEPLLFQLSWKGMDLSWGLDDLTPLNGSNPSIHLDFSIYLFLFIFLIIILLTKNSEPKTPQIITLHYCWFLTNVNALILIDVANYQLCLDGDFQPLPPATRGPGSACLGIVQSDHWFTDHLFSCPTKHIHNSLGRKELWCEQVFDFDCLGWFPLSGWKPERGAGEPGGEGRSLGRRSSYGHEGYPLHHLWTTTPLPLLFLL